MRTVPAFCLQLSYVDKESIGLRDSRRLKPAVLFHVKAVFVFEPLHFAYLFLAALSLWLAFEAQVILLTDRAVLDEGCFMNGFLKDVASIKAQADARGGVRRFCIGTPPAS